MLNKKENNTYKKILKTAQNLIIKEPYHTVSLSMVAEKAGVTKAALYYHFKNKEELFLKIFEKMEKDFKKELDNNIKKDSPSSEKLRAFIIAYINFFFIKKNLIKLLIQEVSKNNKKVCLKLKDIRENIIDKLEKIIEEILKNDKRKNEVSPRIASMMILGMLGTFFVEHAYDNKNKISSKKIADKILNFLNFK